MRIQLLCDQKWRDLPNLAAIKVQLEKLGHRVLLSTTKDAMPMIRAFRPDCVVFNHLFGQRYRDLATVLRKAGVAIVLLPTEGVTHPCSLALMSGESTDYSLADMLLPWNQPVADMITERWGGGEEKVPVVGCTRFDFYDPQFESAVVSREKFCRRFDLDPNKPIITWATQYVFAHLHTSPAEREKFLSDTADFGLDAFFQRQRTTSDEVPAIHYDARGAAAESVLKLVKAIPDAQVILKPHPAEDQKFYRRLIDECASGNLRFCPQDYIWNVLNASEVHLHRHCTTAVEAWNWNKPTIEMAMNSRHESWPEREAGSDIAQDGDGLISLVRGYLDGAKVDEQRRQYRQAYIDRWFGGEHGRRCIRAAEKIDNLLRTRGRQRTMMTPLRGIQASTRQTVTAVMRYLLSLRPNDSLVSRRPVEVVDPKDKQITRNDVRAYTRLVSSALA